MSPFQISPLESADRPAVEALLDLVFGSGRKSKSSYRLRQDGSDITVTFAERAEDRAK